MLNFKMKGISKVFIILILTIAIISCGSGKQFTEAKDLEKVHALMKMDTIKIESDWASPLNAYDIGKTGLVPVGSTAGNINLIGNTNYFKIIGDSLSIDMPYFGERQMAGGYNNNQVGISFNGKPKVFKRSFNEKKNRYEYYFEVNKDTETFMINLNIFPSLRTDIRVNSNQRTFISYNGWVKEQSS